MVPDIGRGSRTHGLLVYLYGPGRREEHTDAHLVGSWDGFAPDPGRDTGHDPDPKVTLARLTAALDLRVKQAGDRAPAKHVWHCSVRTAPGDRRLDDEEWNAVAQRIVHATGIAPAGDPDGCRWIAVRHAEDHIHIVATLIRGDLRNPRLNYDFNKAQAECRRIEQEMVLRRLNAGDGTAAKNPSSAEKFKAERTGRPETSRETLREAVRRAVAGADSKEEFFTRLREAGVRVKLRHAPSGDALGYNVALPGDRNRDGDPVWYPGSKLAPDLSLPKIRLRLTDGAAEPSAPAVAVDRTNWSPPARQRRNAVVIAERSATLLERDEDGEAAAQLVGIGELLDAVAQTSPATTRAELAAAARAFERATRSHVRAERADTRALRSAARGIVQAGWGARPRRGRRHHRHARLHPRPGHPRRRPLALRSRTRSAGPRLPTSRRAPAHRLPAGRRHADASAARPRSGPSRSPAPRARSHPSRRPAGEGRTGRGHGSEDRRLGRHPRPGRAGGPRLRSPPAPGHRHARTRKRR